MALGVINHDGVVNYENMVSYISQQQQQQKRKSCLTKENTNRFEGSKKIENPSLNTFSF